MLESLGARVPPHNFTVLQIDIFAEAAALLSLVEVSPVGGTRQPFMVSLMGGHGWGSLVGKQCCGQ